MYYIYSIGDINYLVTILNGVAMLFNTGIAGNASFIVTGFLLGLLIILVKSLLQQKFQVWMLLFTFAVYSVLFVPKVTVTIEDVYTGNIQVVANIPLGIAAAGSIFSQAGYFITRDFETVFATPDMTAQGFVDPLETLLQMRHLDLGPAAYSGATEDTKHFDLSIYQFLNDCVMRDVATPGPTQQIKLAPMQVKANTWAYFASLTAPGWSTVSWMTPADVAAGGTVVTCDTLETSITNEFNNAGYQTDLQNHMEDSRGVTSIEVQDAMDDMISDGTQALLFMQNAIVASMFNKVLAGYETSSLGASIERTAIEQRRVQGASQRSLFEEIARPLMTWIEGFFYALAPFMVFLVTLGPPGFGLLIKYLMIGLWIQLWTPLMSIVNLYTLMAADNKFAALNGDIPIYSYGGMDQLYTEAGTYLAVAGYLASAVPVLSLAIVTGSTYALVSASEKMQGTGDHVAEKTAAPDIIGNTAPGKQGMGSENATLNSDGTVTRGYSPGGNPVLGTYTSTAQMTNAVNRQGAIANSLSNTLADTISQHYGDNSSFGGRWQENKQTSSEAQASEKKATDYSNDVGQKVASSNNFETGSDAGISGLTSQALTYNAGLQGSLGVNPGAAVGAVVGAVDRMTGGLFSNKSLSGNEVLEGLDKQISKASKAGDVGKAGFLSDLKDSVKGYISADARGEVRGARTEEARSGDKVSIADRLTDDITAGISKKESEGTSFSEATSLKSGLFKESSATHGTDQSNGYDVREAAQEAQQATSTLTAMQGQSAGQTKTQRAEVADVLDRGTGNFVAANSVNRGADRDPAAGDLAQAGKPFPSTEEGQRDLYRKELDNAYVNGDRERFNQLMGYSGLPWDNSTGAAVTGDSDRQRAFVAEKTSPQESSGKNLDVSNNDPEAPITGASTFVNPSAVIKPSFDTGNGEPVGENAAFHTGENAAKLAERVEGKVNAAFPESIEANNYNTAGFQQDAKEMESRGQETMGDLNDQETKDFKNDSKKTLEESAGAANVQENGPTGSLLTSLADKMGAVVDMLPDPVADVLMPDRNAQGDHHMEKYSPEMNQGGGGSNSTQHPDPTPAAPAPQPASASAGNTGGGSAKSSAPATPTNASAGKAESVPAAPVPAGGDSDKSGGGTAPSSAPAPAPATSAQQSVEHPDPGDIASIVKSESVPAAPFLAGGDSDKSGGGTAPSSAPAPAPATPTSASAGKAEGGSATASSTMGNVMEYIAGAVNQGKEHGKIASDVSKIFSMGQGESTNAMIAYRTIEGEFSSGTYRDETEKSIEGTLTQMGYTSTQSQEMIQGYEAAQSKEGTNSGHTATNPGVSAGSPKNSTSGGGEGKADTGHSATPPAASGPIIGSTASSGSKKNDSGHEDTPYEDIISFIGGAVKQGGDSRQIATAVEDRFNLETGSGEDAMFAYRFIDGVHSTGKRTDKGEKEVKDFLTGLGFTESQSNDMLSGYDHPTTSQSAAGARETARVAEGEEQNDNSGNKEVIGIVNNIGDRLEKAFDKLASIISPASANTLDNLSSSGSSASPTDDYLSGYIETSMAIERNVENKSLAEALNITMKNMQEDFGLTEAQAAAHLDSYLDTQQKGSIVNDKDQSEAGGTGKAQAGSTPAQKEPSREKTSSKKEDDSKTSSPDVSYLDQSPSAGTAPKHNESAQSMYAEYYGVG